MYFLLEKLTFQIIKARVQGTNSVDAACVGLTTTLSPADPFPVMSSARGEGNGEPAAFPA